jgi:hypothetical protein
VGICNGRELDIAPDKIDAPGYGRLGAALLIPHKSVAFDDPIRDVIVVDVA